MTEPLSPPKLRVRIERGKDCVRVYAAEAGHEIEVSGVHLAGVRFNEVFLLFPDDEPLPVEVVK
jgi:hypothetical protein